MVSVYFPIKLWTPSVEGENHSPLCSQCLVWYDVPNGQWRKGSKKEGKMSKEMERQGSNQSQIWNAVTEKKKRGKEKEMQKIA